MATVRAIRASGAYRPPAVELTYRGLVSEMTPDHAKQLAAHLFACAHIASGRIDQVDELPVIEAADAAIEKQVNKPRAR